MTNLKWSLFFTLKLVSVALLGIVFLFLLSCCCETSDHQCWYTCLTPDHGWVISSLLLETLSRKWVGFWLEISSPIFIISSRRQYMPKFYGESNISFFLSRSHSPPLYCVLMLICQQGMCTCVHNYLMCRDWGTMFCPTRPQTKQGPGECCRGWDKLVCAHIAAVVCVSVCGAHGGSCIHS